MCPPAELEGCCLELHETVLVLVALILVVQLALKLAAVICYYLCYLLRSLSGMILAKESEKPKSAPAAMRKTRSRKPSAQWSEPDIPRRRRWESSPPHSRCVHCTLEPVKLTMNVQNDHSPCKEHHRVGQRPSPDYPTYHSPRCDYCECDNRYRPRTALAPLAYVTRCRDVACGSSEPMLFSGSSERRNTFRVPSDLYPRVGETQYRSVGTPQDIEYLGGSSSRSRRPTKVYIYPVHPQTPPGSRSASPERLHRRRGNLGISTEETQEYEPREQRHKSREPEQQGGGSPGLTRFHNVAASVGKAVQTEPPSPKQRHAWPDQPAGSDWVYRPLK